jgi:hypothetical protein
VLVPALFRLVRGVLVRGLCLPDVQPRRLRLCGMLGLLRELHLRRLHLPNLRPRRVSRSFPLTDLSLKQW